MESKTALTEKIYKQLLAAWKTNDAEAYARLFAEDGDVVGFDGSEMHGRDDIQKQLQQIFTNHSVASYVAIVRSVKQWSENIFMLTAIVGMLPPQSSTVNPKVNAVQTLVVSFEHGKGRILLFQNTPAAYHEHPEKVEQITHELNSAVLEK